MGKRGEIIDIGIDAVTVTRSADGQQRVLIKIPDRMLDNPTSSTTYREGRPDKICQQLPTSQRAMKIGGTLSNHRGVRLVIIQSTRGVYVNLNLQHPKLVTLLREIALEMLAFAEEFEQMLENRATLLAYLAANP